MNPNASIEERILYWLLRQDVVKWTVIMICISVITTTIKYCVKQYCDALRIKNAQNPTIKRIQDS